LTLLSGSLPLPGNRRFKRNIPKRFPGRRRYLQLTLVITLIALSLLVETGQIRLVLPF